ncbi:MAG: N-glycosylase/DNA lyase [Bacteroidetes bacterium]|nr:N-glycosylase/DNA lyase [Bacteroidota bacterium]MCW5894812.1 N-glycosylase/DNA lyase [Bacteroidota bacterium]
MHYEHHRETIRQRLNGFASVTPDEYFYELVYCLLTPQSSAVNAGKTVEALRADGFPEKDIDVASVLFRKQHYIRFHNTKAKRLMELKAMQGEILAALSNRMPADDLRKWLVKNVKGLGWKEASHFLRNIGHRNLAILDRHILKNLKYHGVIRSMPATLTAKRYLDIERKFKAFADSINISMDELDLLFWSNETGQILK